MDVVKSRYVFIYILSLKNQIQKLYNFSDIKHVIQ